MAWQREPERHSLSSKGIHNAHLYGLSMKAKIMPHDVNPKELAMGVKIEMEHTPDRKIAERIALDHLTEFSDYYSGLTKLEKVLTPRK